MSITCLQRPRKRCAEINSIKKHRERQEVVFVLGYDWNAKQDGSHFIESLCKRIQDEVHNQYPMPKIMFKKLKGETGSIFCKICKQIQRADIAIFNVSTHNPNVLLELGLATGCGKLVYILRSNDIPPPLTSLSDLRDVFEFRFTLKEGILNFGESDFEKELNVRLSRIAKKKQETLIQRHRELVKSKAVVMH